MTLDATYESPSIAVVRGRHGLGVLANTGKSEGWVLVEHLLPDELDNVEQRLRQTTDFPWWEEFEAARQIAAA